MVIKIKSEEELIKRIKDKTFNEIIIFFKEYHIKPEELNHFHATLLYLIKHKTSFEIIEFIIRWQQRGNKQLINNTEALFYAIENNDFNLAKLLLRNGTKITNKNHPISNNIIEYLLKVDKLNKRNLLFALNITKDVSIVTKEFLFSLFSRLYYDKEKILETLFNYKFIVNTDAIVDTLLMSKKKILLSNKAFQEYVSSNLHPVININMKNETGNTLLLCAINSNHSVEEVQLLIKYAKENHITLNINENNNQGDFPLLSIFNKPDVTMKMLFHQLTKYSRESNTLLELNKTNNEGEYPLLFLIKMGCIRSYFNRDISVIYTMIKELITYAKENRILLHLNEKDKDGNYPLFLAKKKKDDDVEFKKIIQLLVKYANEYNIVLENNNIESNNQNNDLKKEEEEEGTVLFLKSSRANRIL
ncbi:hypothetical protein PIROE2DRAFT_69649 [Piromyces sp. E2]|nr:hypothetical protein PIROE2DRAFT_69649 [Piromyces sp. E2]|eukprot:OUM61133.1 hypothetical protein PIROE2DRAFT_69649 [Piromyces sp. E2]